jgi:phospholipid/cholesterol/gamma-HCH transport system permease protein
LTTSALSFSESFKKLNQWVGNSFINGMSHIGGFVLYAKEAAKLAVRRPFRYRLIFQQMEFIGNESLMIIMISGFFIGAVFSLQIGSIFAIFGAQGMIGAATGKSLTRELSPLVTGFLVTGRGGAAITAELATMKVNEQVDAMEAMAVDPVHYLVVPRLIASILMFPFLVAVFNFTGQLGSLAVSALMFNVDQGVYFDKLVRIVELDDIWSGMQKAFAFATIIALLACYYGLNARGGAKGVGLATTNSVVVTLLVILGVDFIITYFQVVL